MTLEQAYYIGELIAALAVIVSLIYVGRQVKQNTDATQIQAAQAFVDMYNTFNSYLASSNELSELWYRGIVDFNGLSKLELIRFNALAGQWYRISESAWQQWNRGAVDEDMWLGITHQIADTVSTPGIQEWRKTRQHWYGPRFSQWVDDLLSSEEGTPMYAYMKDRPE